MLGQVRDGVKEVAVRGKQDSLACYCPFKHAMVVTTGRLAVAHIEHLVPPALEQGSSASREVLVEAEPHGTVS